MGRDGKIVEPEHNWRLDVGDGDDDDDDELTLPQLDLNSMAWVRKPQLDYHKEK
jgi:hypothetical protein